MTKPALVVSGGGFQGLGLVQALAVTPDVETHVADIYPDNVTKYLTPYYHVVPPVSSGEEFDATLLSIIRTHSVEFVFPATAIELPRLAALRSDLEREGVDVAVSVPELVEVLLDKERTNSWLRAARIPAQDAVAPELHDFSFPIFGKPKQGWGGKGMLLARTALELEREVPATHAGDLVWVPYIEDFDEYSIDFAILGNGEVSPMVARRRIRTSGGFAVVSETVRDRHILELGAAVSDALVKNGGRGLFNVQVIRIRPAGDWFVSDVNPRAGTSGTHSLIEGVNLPGLYIGRSSGQRSRINATRMRSVRFLKDVGIPVLAAPPKAVVFDLDDTLVDHKLWMVEKLLGAYHAVATRWADPDSFLVSALRLIDEGERSHLVDRVAEAHDWTNEQRMKLISAYREVEVGRTPVYQDVGPVLEALRAAGFVLAILTDNPVATQQSKIRNAPELKAISHVFFSRDFFKEKPDGRPFLGVSDALSLAPSDICMVGDNFFRDAIGAIRAGFRCAFLINRPGAFVASHPGLRRMSRRLCQDAEVYEVESLFAVRESLASSRICTE